MDMLWGLQDLLSHPMGGLVCAVLARQRAACLWGPLLLGLVLGWGAVPVVWLLTREAHSKPHSDEPWTDWPGDYFALRQRVVLSTLLVLVPLPGLALVILSAFLPTMVSLHEGMSLELSLTTRILIFLTKFMRTPTGFALLWAFLALWPVCLALLLQSGYRLPILGRVWRHADRVWWLSGLVVPSEVRFRSPARAEETNLETERAALREASSNSRILGVLALVIWFLCLIVLLASLSFPLYRLQGSIR